MENIHLELRKDTSDFILCRTLSALWHMHREIELVYVKKGHVLCCADNTTHELSDGDIFLCFPNQIHYYIDSSEGEYLLFIFSPEIMYSISGIFYDGSPSDNVFRGRENSPIIDLLEKAFYTEGEYALTVRTGLLNQAVPLLLSRTKILPHISDAPNHMRDILNYCLQHFQEPLSLDILSAALHISKFHISRLFNKNLKISFNKYINTLRVNEACRLMEDETKSLSFISEEVGFGSIRSFNRAFKEIMNTTPLKHSKKSP